MNKILTIFLLVIFLPACSPSQASIQTAIAQTMAANPTTTPTITHTVTPIQSDTPTNTPLPTLTTTLTLTPTSNLSPTPDLRIIDMDPQKFFLEQKDFPKEGLYYLPGPTWVGKNTNEQIIIAWGVDKGRDYVINTGRVSAWWEAYNRGTLAVKMPKEINCEIVLYKTAAGAQLSAKKYNYVETNPIKGWKYVDRKMDLGDINLTYALYKMDAGGQKNTNYVIEFTYRNIMVDITGFDYKEEFVPPDFIENLARIVLNKLQQAPLVNPEDAVLAK